jgi:hypothetical protein
MLRRLLADFAFVRAQEAVDRAEAAVTLKSHLFWTGRSRWWADVECWLSGLGSWRELRASRERRARQHLPFVVIPSIEGPRNA